MSRNRLYAIAYLSFDDPDNDGQYLELEVGAWCEMTHSGVEVEEPDVSAPNCSLKEARLVDYDLLPKGWESYAAEKLSEAAIGLYEPDDTDPPSNRYED